MLKKLRSVFYGWWIVAACLLIFAFVGGTNFYGFTAFFSPIVLEMGWTSAQTSLAFSLRSVESGFLMPALGFIVDRIGSRKCIFTGIIITGTALILLSRIQSLAAFYATFLLLALGTSCCLGLAQYTAVANWFTKRRALALGILSAGFGVSGIMTPILNQMIGTNGWRDTLVIVGIATYAIGIPLSLVVRHRPEPYGYLPDGAPPQNQPESEVKPAGSETEQQPAAGREVGIREALKDRNFWLMMIFGFGTSFSITAITVHEMPFLTSVGIPNDLAALTMLGITGSSLIGRLGFAWLGDKHSKKRLLAIAATLQTIGVFLFAHISSPWMIIPFLLTFGPGYGGPIPLQPALQADYFGTKKFATLRGVYSISWTIPGIIGPFLAGWIYDVQGSYKLAFIIFAILCSLAVPAILMVKPAGKPASADL